MAEKSKKKEPGGEKTYSKNEIRKGHAGKKGQDTPAKEL